MDHKDLEAWKQAMDLVQTTYQSTQRFPKEEIWGLTSQMRRSAVSIPSNIAEGAARRTNLDFGRFLYIALGSLAELETQTLIAHRLGYLLEHELLIDKINHTKKLVVGLIKHLDRKNKT